MKEYTVTGYNKKDQKPVILFEGTKTDCIDWIWDNCDIGDLRMNGYHKWSGFAYYEENDTVYKIAVDEFYRY